MKKLRNYFVMLTVAIMALFCSSCSDSDDEEELGPFVEYSEAATFHSTYKAYNKGEKALIDTRDAASYNAGHLAGAVNFPATVQNTSSDNAEWCQELKAKYPTSTCLFFYGQSSMTMVKTIAGRASRIGYGKENSRITPAKYDELKSLFGVE